MTDYTTAPHYLTDITNNHRVHAVSFTDQTARLAGSGIQAHHLDKIIKQASDGQFFRVSQISPLRYQPFAPADATPSDANKTVMLRDIDGTNVDTQWVLDTADNIYDKEAGLPRVVTVDDGLVRWDLQGGHDFIVSITNGSNSKFSVLATGHTWEISLDESDGAFVLDAETIGLTAGASADITFEARGGSVTLNESGQASLSGYTATSIIGALNEAKGDVTGFTNDTVLIGASDGTIDEATGVTYNSTGQEFKTDVQSLDLSASSSAVLEATGGFSDLTLGARGNTINLSQFGQEALSGYTATSLIGALNEIRGDVAGFTNDTVLIGASDGTIDEATGVTYNSSIQEFKTNVQFLQLDSTLGAQISGGASSLTLRGLNASTNLNESGQVSLSGYTATSIIGALNEAKSDVTGFTQGAVLFGAADGSITEDGPNLFFDTSNDYIGLGTNTPIDRVGIKSAGGTTIAQLGATLLTNGDFATDLSSWTAGAGWAWSAGTALHTAGNTAALAQGISVSNGAQYQAEVTISGRTAGSVTASFPGSPESASLSTNATHTFTFRAASTSTIDLTFTPTTDFDGALDDVSFKLITPASTYDFAVYDSTGARSDAVITAGSASLHNSNIGIGAGRYNTTGTNNVNQGYRAGYSNTTGSNNVNQGPQAGINNTTGSANVNQGYLAGYGNTTGSNNVNQGYLAGVSSTTGSNNVNQGYQAGYSNTTGGINVNQGYQSGYSNTTGGGNVNQGYQAGYNNISGNFNSNQGYRAGRYTSTGAANETSSNCTMLGYDTRVNASGDTNETAIGNGAIGIGSNTVTLGNSSVTQTRLGGIASTVNGGVSSGRVGNALSMGHDSSSHVSWIQSYGTGGTDLQLNPEGGKVVIGAIEHKTTTVNAATWTLGADEYRLHVTYTATGTCNITLPEAQAVDGRTVIVFDAGGNSANNEITLTAGGSSTINGAASTTIQTDYRSATIYGEGGDWFAY